MSFVIISKDQFESYLPNGFEIITNTYAKEFIYDLQTTNKEELWDILPTRIKYGVPAAIAPLTKIKGIGGVKAKKMWEKGFEDLRSIADPKNKSLLTMIFKPMEAKRIMKEAQSLIEG